MAGRWTTVALWMALFVTALVAACVPPASTPAPEQAPVQRRYVPDVEGIRALYTRGDYKGALDLETRESKLDEHNLHSWSYPCWDSWDYLLGALAEAPDHHTLRIVRFESAAKYARRCREEERQQHVESVEELLSMEREALRLWAEEYEKDPTFGRYRTWVEPLKAWQAFEDDHGRWTDGPLRSCVTFATRLLDQLSHENPAFAGGHASTADVDEAVTALKASAAECLRRYGEHAVPDGASLLPELRALVARADAKIAAIDPRELARSRADRAQEDAAAAARQSSREHAEWQAEKAQRKNAAQAAEDDKARAIESCKRAQSTGPSGTVSDACKKLGFGPSVAPAPVATGQKTCPVCNGSGVEVVDYVADPSRATLCARQSAGSVLVDCKVPTKPITRTCVRCGGSGKVAAY